MKIGIIGTGAMGSGIAQVALMAGETVTIYDLNDVARTKAVAMITAGILKSVEKGKISQEAAETALNSLSTTERLEGLGASDVVIEAIIEDLSIKQSVFKELEMYVSDTCILASNTSSLSITAIAGACRKAERVVGIHFFNPAPLMALVEIIPALQTNPTTTEKSIATIQKWGKTTVVAKDTPGFIVNRIARPFYGESIRILEEGIADMATIDWALTEIGGFKMGAFALMDLIGHDVNYAVTETVWRNTYFDARYKPSITQKRLVEAQFFGKKTGRGCYDYTPNAMMPTPRKDINLGQMIVERVLAMLINEAADALFWNIASHEDIETAMTKGVNYPKGLLAWAKELGYQNVVNILDNLYDRYKEERYRCSPFLKNNGIV